MDIPNREPIYISLSELGDNYEIPLTEIFPGIFTLTISIDSEYETELPYYIKSEDQSHFLYSLISDSKKKIDYRQLRHMPGFRVLARSALSRISTYYKALIPFRMINEPALFMEIDYFLERILTNRINFDNPPVDAVSAEKAEKLELFRAETQDKTGEYRTSSAIFICQKQQAAKIHALVKKKIRSNPWKYGAEDLEYLDKEYLPKITAGEVKAMLKDMYPDHFHKIRIAS